MATKRAVCVGINYPGTSAQLSGCVNDALEWASLLQDNQYTDVTLILDSVATKAAILSTLRKQISLMKWGDRLVFTFSGHGSWVPDKDGDEADGRDEVLVPADYANGSVITDDELQEILSHHPNGSSVLIISDSCHSGTLSRSFSMTGVAAPGAPKFLTPAALLPGLSEERAAVLEARTEPNSPPRRTASLISGCLDQEFSYDAWFGGRANGAFSRAAIDTYHPGISLNAWHKAIRLKLPSSSFPQTPILTPASLYRKYSKAL